jgi:folate-binding protein YgfZ
MPQFDDHFMTVTALTDPGILEIRGRDAVKFLQGYCTCDLLTLTENQALYGAITNIQGRVETTFIAILDTAHVLTPLDEPSILLRMSRTCLPYIQEFLAKYAVFSKVTLIDRSQDIVCFGCDEAVSAPSGLVVKIPQRPTAYEFWSRTAIQATSNLETWKALEIQAGLAWLDQPQAGKYQPFELGMADNASIDFQKGCYLGQEIIARVHYRGKTKTVFRVGSAEGACRPGDPIYAGAKPCGEVINSAGAGATTACSVIIQTDVLTQSLTIHSRPFVLQP